MYFHLFLDQNNAQNPDPDLITDLDQHIEQDTQFNQDLDVGQDLDQALV